MKDHSNEHSKEFHGPELNTITTPNGAIELSIYEYGMPPHFRLSGAQADQITVETNHDSVVRIFPMVNRGNYWESTKSIPEPHEFSTTISLTRNGSVDKYETYFAEHEHEHEHGHDHGEHGHSHGLVDKSIVRSKDGVRVVSWSLVVLTIAALVQTAVYFSTHSLSLLADLIHNFGDALTAIPLGAAFLLRNRHAEKLSGYFVVAVIFVSAVVVAFEALNRLMHPQPVVNLLALTIAGIIGFLGNEAAAIIRMRGGKRLNSSALIADGMHARVDGWVSLSVVASAALVYLGFTIADPLIGLGMSIVILRITWRSFRAIKASKG